MKVTLTRRWGPHKPGVTVTVPRSMGDWLLHTGYADQATPTNDQPEQAEPTPKPSRIQTRRRTKPTR